MAQPATVPARTALGRFGQRVAAIIAECNYAQRRSTILRMAPDAYQDGRVPVQDLRRVAARAGRGTPGERPVRRLRPGPDAALTNTGLTNTGLANTGAREHGVHE